MRLSVAIPLLALACAHAPSGRSAEQGVAATLDDFHDAAAEADEARYFGHFAADGVFLGTDATERWTVEQFRAYAHPHFEKKQAWTFRAVRRSIASDGRYAWFDEDLQTAKLGPARGSGVLRYEGGAWRIVRYDLALTVPNERFETVRKAVAGEPLPCP